MRRTHRIDGTATVPRLVSRLAVPLLATITALAALCAAPRAADAQDLSGRPLVFDQYLSRTTLDRSVAGARARLEGVGFRLTRPLAAPEPRRAPRLAARVAVGGFVNYARSRNPGLTTWQYGVLADVPVRAATFAGAVEPLASLGVGALRARRAPTSDFGPSPECLAPTDVFVRRPAASCVMGLSREQLGWRTNFALSPALGVRVGLGRGLALRTDLRDVIVYRGGPRHGYEIATGLSFVR